MSSELPGRYALYSRVFRPLLFALPPEQAHRWALRALVLWAAFPPRLRPFSAWGHRVHDPVVVAGLRFPNRVGLAAGLDKNATYAAPLACLGFGFIELGTVTPEPQNGNPYPRLFRLSSSNALINRMGFNNTGLAVFLKNLKHAQQALRAQHLTPPIWGISLGKNAKTPLEQAHEDYLKGLQAVYALADYVAINISSPNTQNLRRLQDDSSLDALLNTLMHHRDQLAQTHGRQVPLFLKIAPDLSTEQLEVVIRLCHRYGLQNDGLPNQRLGVIATNTTLSREGVEGLPHAHETGGLSGGPLTHKSQALIKALRAGLGPTFPLIGSGGVMSAQDAQAHQQVGADLVQIYTGLIYKGPGLISQVGQRLVQLK